MPIFEKEKVIFIHIPKTAGTSIGTLFDTNYQKKCFSLDHFKHNTFIEYSNLLKNKINNYTIFSFIRNPYDRILSYFKFHLERDAKLSKLKNEIVKENNISNQFSLYLDLTLNNKILSYKNEPYLVSRTQTCFLINDNNTIDPKIKIFKYENLDKQLPNLPKLNISKSNLLKKDIYNKDNIQIIKKYFLEDFVNFNYTTEIEL
jgi:hypothetical protein